MSEDIHHYIHERAVSGQEYSHKGLFGLDGGAGMNNTGHLTGKTDQTVSRCMQTIVERVFGIFLPDPLFFRRNRCTRFFKHGWIWKMTSYWGYHDV